VTDEARSRLADQCAVSRETMARLEILAAELNRWNAAINLVSKQTLPDVWRRHILDSAQLFSLAPTGARRWVDLGAGGGFPGLVIAAMARDSDPGPRVTLVESDARKCAFLASTARAMGLDVAVENRRIEQPPAHRYDVVSARALARLGRLVALAAPYLTADGVALFSKGAGVDDELTEARLPSHIAVRRLPSISGSGGVILQLKGLGGVTHHDDGA